MPPLDVLRKNIARHEARMRLSEERCLERDVIVYVRKGCRNEAEGSLRI